MFTLLKARFAAACKFAEHVNRASSSNLRSKRTRTHRIETSRQKQQRQQPCSKLSGIRMGHYQRQHSCCTDPEVNLSSGSLGAPWDLGTWTDYETGTDPRDHPSRRDVDEAT